MAASPSIDRSAFLGFLRASALVGDAQFEEITRRYADVTRGRALARLLVQDGSLTRFQAERLLVGRTSGFLLGQYRILEQIGRGGMGRVYKAQHRTMRRVVALKVLTPEMLKTDRAVELFLREVRAAAQLVHPNIVTAFDANEVEGRYYLVLEFVDGPNLDQLVRRQGPLPVGLACDYIRQAATGLQCAHLLGMVHRDIKPANILAQRHGLNGESSPGLVKISDFGLARLAIVSGEEASADTIVTKDNTVMGTPDYLSPEQSRSLRTTDIRSDLYSLGCTFYFLLTGQVPYPGGSALEKLIRHATTSPRLIRELRPDVPEAVIAIVGRLMEKAPEARFQTPSELAESLQPFAVGGATPWAPASRSVPTIDPEALAPPTDDILPARPPEAGELADALAVSEHEVPALVNTVTNDASPTPGPVAECPSRLIRRPDPGAKARFRLALLSALAVVGTLVLLAVVAALAGR